MKNKLAHYIAQAKVDLCNWNFKDASYFVIGNPSEGRSHPNFVKFVGKTCFEELLNIQ